MVEIVANARKQTSISRLEETASEIRFRANRPMRTKYRPHLVKSRQLVIDQPRPRDYGPTTTVKRLDVTEIDRLICR